MTWKPLLTGSLLERAREALAEISSSLESGPLPHAQTDWPERIVRTRTASLGGGFASLALYFGYLRQTSGEERHAHTGLDLLDRATEVASSERMESSLYTGFTGIAWTSVHLAGRIYPQPAEDSHLEADELLLEHITRMRRPLGFDLIGGLTGIGVYALERLPRPSARRILEAILDRLEDVSERTPSGTTWLTPPEAMAEYWRKMRPEGAYDLGVAHGVPGIIGLLAGLQIAGIAEARVGLLLESAVSWLLCQRLPEGSPSRYPGMLVRGRGPTPSRLAWCYGDPGIATILWLAAEAMDRDDWRREALDTARAAAIRPVETAGIRDACICHGMSGLAHLFNRLHQASGDELLGRAALTWFERALDARTPGRGLGGYLFERSSPGSADWVKEPGLLNGSAGVGLALLAAGSAVEPEWDRALLACLSTGAS